MALPAAEGVGPQGILTPSREGTTFVKMGFLDRFLKKQRRFWFVCYTCMVKTGDDPLKSVFYYDGPPENILGRAMTRCPRCGETNTRSFRQLKDDGSEAALWGLEQLVKKYPRSQFEVKRA